MVGPGREERAISQLLKAAQSNVARFEARLGALEEAELSATRTLESLVEAMTPQEARRAAGLHPNREFASYLEGAAEKRAVLASTLSTLRAEIVEVRRTLDEAMAEIDKLRRFLGGRRRGRSGSPAGGPAIVATKRAGQTRS